MKNLATLFYGHRVYGLGKAHPRKVYHFVQVYLPLYDKSVRFVEPGIYDS